MMYFYEVIFRTFITCLALLILIGCTDKKPSVKKTVINPSLIHPFLFQEELYAQINFPVWFNDSIVRSSGLRQIVRLTYSSFETDPDSPQMKETFPRLKTVYTFSPEGKLIQLTEIHFADGIEISRSTYSIDEGKEDGIYHAEYKDSSAPSANFMMVDFLGSTQKIAEYSISGAGRKLFVIPKKANWGPLSVDSLAHPANNDWIVLGNPEKPSKRYQVKNIVTEKNVTRYSYLAGNYPGETVWNDYPFRQKRSFTYNKSGIFCGYVDSTFMDNSFVTRNITIFELDNRQFPVEIVHYKGLNSEGSRFRTVERFNYINFSDNEK